MRHPRRNYARAPAFIPEDPGLGMPMLCPSQNSIPGYGTATCEMCRGGECFLERRDARVRTFYFEQSRRLIASSNEIMTRENKTKNLKHLDINLKSARHPLYLDGSANAYSF